MSVLVAYSPGDRSRAALHLGGMVARSTGDPLVVSSVVPGQWPPTPGRVDAEYRAQIDAGVEQALVTAAEALPADLSATFIVHHARSTPVGLLEVAAQYDARVMVLGSSSAGVFGRVALGSVTSALCHSSPVPLALAPRGFRCRERTRVTRVTAAYGGTVLGSDTPLAAARMAARVDADLRIASFAVQPASIFQAGVGSERAEAEMLDEWLAELVGARDVLLTRMADLDASPRSVEAVIGYGRSWDEAMDDVEWDTGDVLTVGSSSLGAADRVFLGSRAAKIVRHSPVPVVLAPRGTPPRPSPGRHDQR